MDTIASRPDVRGTARGREVPLGPAGVPVDPAVDSTLALLREGYRFIPSRCERWGTDVFVARLLGRPAVCMRGREAARLFYDARRFRRADAIPIRIRRSLFGEHAVQTLDDEAHRRRKALFMSVMTPESIARLAGLSRERWREAAVRWSRRGRVVLFDEARRVLCEAACGWAGLPLRAAEAPLRAAQLSAMVDAFGAIGPRHWRGRIARRSVEPWVERIVERVRGGAPAPAGSPLELFSSHRGPDGERLPARVAAVELINLVRPTVAIAYYVAFAALALHQHPRWRAEIAAGDDAALHRFVQEVRRFYPFAPFVGAKTRQAFEWRGLRFREGTLVLLDLYGTDHDPRTWESPEAFRPERFERWDGSPFAFVPQGGGDFDTGHRCAGEWITIELAKAAAAFLAREIDWAMAPRQDLSLDLSRMPALPRDRVRIERVRPR